MEGGFAQIIQQMPSFKPTRHYTCEGLAPNACKKFVVDFCSLFLHSFILFAVDQKPNHMRNHN